MAAEMLSESNSANYSWDVNIIGFVWSSSGCSTENIYRPPQISGVVLFYIKKRHL